MKLACLAWPAFDVECLSSFHVVSDYVLVHSLALFIDLVDDYGSHCEWVDRELLVLTDEFSHSLVHLFLVVDEATPVLLLDF